jgi:hypothetical protein
MGDDDQQRQLRLTHLQQFMPAVAIGRAVRGQGDGCSRRSPTIPRQRSPADASGPALVFERLWEKTGCRVVIEDLAGARKHGCELERAVFLTVLHRLFGGGSDRAADRWREDYRIARHRRAL